MARFVIAAMSVVLFGSILWIPSAAWAVPVPWKNCGTSTDAISIQQISASVWPPQAGKSLTVSYRLNLAETLNRGAFEQVTTTRQSGRTVHKRMPFEQPVEEMFSAALMPHPTVESRILPLPAGPYSKTFTLVVPQPKASTSTSASPIGVDLTGYDSAGREIVCMQVVVPVK